MYWHYEADLRERRACAKLSVVEALVDGLNRAVIRRGLELLAGTTLAALKKCGSHRLRR